MIENNVFNKTSGYQYGAIFCSTDGALPKVRFNTFICTTAIFTRDSEGNTANPDLGTPSEPGNNDFSSVSGASLTHHGSSDIQAYGNTWPNWYPVLGADIIIGSDEGNVGHVTGEWGQY